MHMPAYMDVPASSMDVRNLGLKLIRPADGDVVGGNMLFDRYATHFLVSAMKRGHGKADLRVLTNNIGAGTIDEDEGVVVDHTDEFLSSLGA
jgi:hypothetical protein